VTQELLHYSIYIISFTGASEVLLKSIICTGSIGLYTSGLRTYCRPSIFIVKTHSIIIKVAIIIIIIIIVIIIIEACTFTFVYIYYYYHPFLSLTLLYIDCEASYHIRVSKMTFRIGIA
jgi:hypothetical protein